MRVALWTLVSVALLVHPGSGLRPEVDSGSAEVDHEAPPLVAHAMSAPKTRAEAREMLFGMPLEQLSVLFNTILSFGCSTCILIATWPFRGLMMSWFFTRHKYTWPTHIMMTWFDVGCIGLFTTNLYAFLTYEATMDHFDVASGLRWQMWQGNFLVNCVMQGLWGAHNLHQWIIIMRGADKGTETEWRRPYPMFLWSLLGACGTGFARNLISIQSGAMNPTVVWVTGVYEVICLLLIVVDLFYFLLFEHSCGMNMAEDYGKDD